MFISMQHVLLWVGWEVDGVDLNAILVLTLADLQLLFATCKPHPPSSRMLISPFPEAPASEQIPALPCFSGMGGAHTQREGLCRAFQINDFELLKGLPLIWLSAASLSFLNRLFVNFLITVVQYKYEYRSSFSLHSRVSASPWIVGWRSSLKKWWIYWMIQIQIS